MNWHKLRVARLQATGAPACTHHSQGAKKHSIRIESLKFWLTKVAASACTPFRNEIRHRLGRCHRCWWPQVLLLWAHCLCCKRVAARGSKIRGHLIGKHHFPKYVYYLCWLGWIPDFRKRVAFGDLLPSKELSWRSCGVWRILRQTDERPHNGWSGHNNFGTWDPLGWITRPTCKWRHWDTVVSTGPCASC